MATRIAAELQSLRYAEDVKRLYHQLRRSICQSLLGLANALEAKDPYTRGHSERVGAWGGRLATAMSLPPGEVETITQAGLLHDIGKIGVPEAVLRKRAGLAPDEWALMRQHPVIGAQIVAPFEFFAGGSLVIRHHHERWDGTGYPDGLAGDDIPLAARVIGAAEVYDALSTARPYQERMTADQAVRRMEELSGSVLDPAVYQALSEVVTRRRSLVFLDEAAEGPI